MFEEAIQIAQDAIQAGDSKAKSVELAKYMNNLSMCHHSRGDKHAALKLQVSALRLKEQHLSPGDPSVGQAYLNIGASQESLGQLDEAKSSYNDARRCIQASLGTAHPLFGAVLNNMAGILFKVGRGGEALQMWEEALSCWKAAYGHVHSQVAAALHNIGWAYAKQGHHSMAKRVYRESVGIKIKIYGSENHLDVATTLSNLGGLHYKCEEFGLAKDTFGREISIYEALDLNLDTEEFQIAKANYEAACAAHGADTCAQVPCQDSQVHDVDPCNEYE